jgi:cell wall-associated NlpC family hydrolase
LRSNTLRKRRRLALAGLTALFALAAAAPASAQTGGTPPPGSTESTSTTPAPTGPTGPTGRAKLRKDGTAVAPANAPPAVQNAIAAGNAIRTMPYRWGGGHRSFSDTGYDCSGAISYVLNGAGMLASPMPSGPFMSWGEPGKGQWITVYANAGHMYAVIAGLRFDTSAVGEKVRQGSGPRWRRSKRKPAGYAVRHYQGY